jgi:hypothetical protein
MNKQLTPFMYKMKIVGKAILFASMQFAIGSVEMSSKFSVKNFSKDQDTLDNAYKSLVDYMVIATFWTAGTSMVFGASYGKLGLISNISANLGIMLWVYVSYMKAFKTAVEKYNLKMPGESDIWNMTF